MRGRKDFTHKGLLFEYSGEGVYYYSPSTEFIVDGIRYGVERIGTAVRPIVDAYDDHLDTCRCQQGAFPMQFSAPPTEAELDRYVRTGEQP
jgi:hypothetical protein